MDDMYLKFSNYQIYLQIALWLLCFYWVDFELFIYLLNNYYYMKILLGMVLMTSQLFLCYYLYNLIKVDSIFKNEINTELENISEKHDHTTCKKCNILRPRRAHHCRYCNKCILKMDHHSFLINKCIGKNNYIIYMKYLISVELVSSYIFWITLFVCIEYYSEFTIYTFIKYGILIFGSFMGSLSLLFYLLFQLYIYLADLTTLEFIYPSLRINSDYVQKN